MRFIQRSEKILESLKNVKYSSFEELKNKINCSISTVRRDIKKLQDQGKIFISHGSICIKDFPNNKSFYQFSENFQFYNDTLTVDNTYYEIDDPINPEYGLAYNDHNYDFNTKSLNWQSVFRWEYRPGSVLFFVWSFSSYEDQELLDFNISKSYRKLFEQVATHKFLIKYNYWMKL